MMQQLMKEPNLYLEEQIQDFLSKIRSASLRDSTEANQIIIDFCKFCNEHRLSVWDIFFSFFADNEKNETIKLLLEKMYALSNKVEEINSNIAHNEIPRNTFINGISQFRDIEQTLTNSMKNLGETYHSKSVEILKYLDFIKEQITPLDYIKIFHNQVDDILQDVKTMIEKNSTNNSILEKLEKIGKLNDSSVEKINNILTLIESKNIEKVEQPIKEMTTLPEEVSQKEQKIINKIKQMRSDGLSTDQIIGKLRISKETYKDMIKKMNTQSKGS